MSASRIGAGSSTQPGAYLGQFRDNGGRWLVPSLDGGPPLPDGFTGADTRSAVIDTGVIAEHPVIARVLFDDRDLTGEGIGDRNGHGTMVALILLSTAPDTALASIKAFRADGSGDLDTLLEAMRVAGQLEIDSINISGGVCQPDCEGDCVLCQEAVRLCEHRHIVVAAAGNTPGQTDCPAKAAVLKGAGFAVSAWDIDEMRFAPYSGEGTVSGPVGHITMKPVPS